MKFMRRTNDGFTLTEALVTITMIGIMASISVASLQPLQQKQRLGQATQQVEQAIRKAQQTAIARSQRVYIEFNPDNTSYTLKSGDPCSGTRTTLLTETLPAQVQVNTIAPGGSTLNTGGCPGATNLLLPFNFQGMVMKGNAGRFLRLNSTAPGNNFGNYDVYILTELGDVGIAKP
jgi:prepilin-type N-terminal cleavage/methylation domain-containing protein